MGSTVRARIERWAAQTVPGGPVARFRVAFAGIWLLYDALDLAYGGTAVQQWIGLTPHPVPLLAAIQVGLIAAEAALLVGVRPRVSALAAFALRALEAYLFFRLNDFYYFCVIALILAHCRMDGGDEPRWPVDLLLWQTGWMYFATASLKLSRVWLSGGHLFVRHAYLASAHDWPYPTFYRTFVSTLAGNAVLAWAGVALEFTLAYLIFSRRSKRLAVAAAIGVHGFAAVALNVWFFGASMTAQVALLLP
jgi:hypothetical protein